MKKPKKLFYVILCAAFAVFAWSGISLFNVTRAAAPAIELQDDVIEQIETTNLEVALSEKTAKDGTATILADKATILGGVTKFTPGTAVYDEIAAANTADAPEFVRIIVRTYWKNADGVKDLSLNTDWIKLDYNGSAYNTGGWVLNGAESTRETDVYYLTNVLPAGATSVPLFNGITVDKKVASEYVVHEDTENRVITYEYKYDQCSACIELEVQSVQTTDATNAIRSVWGVRNVTASGTTLSVQ